MKTALCLLIYSAVVHAQSVQWVGLGPEGGYIQALAPDPVTPTTLYSGSAGGGVFKSVDAGATWTAINSGLTNKSVYAIAVDPINPSTIYAGTHNVGGIFKTVDGGGSWTAVNTGLSNVVLQSPNISASALF